MSGFNIHIKGLNEIRIKFSLSTDTNSDTPLIWPIHIRQQHMWCVVSHLRRQTLWLFYSVQQTCHKLWCRSPGMMDLKANGQFLWMPGTTQVQLPSFLSLFYEVHIIQLFSSLFLSPRCNVLRGAMVIWLHLNYMGSLDGNASTQQSTANTESQSPENYQTFPKLQPDEKFTSELRDWSKSWRNCFLNELPSCCLKAS